MLRVIVGTAGHIDHGKTRLLEALTGIDCDRWAEEKARGITIDLGFAHLHDDDLQLGFVDVPGHQRFLHNALAGLGGIRLLLLVVAADEGVKPQTREHLAIASLLGIERAVVALSKRDLVDRDLLELAELEVGELLERTPFAGAAILAVSSTTGEGIEELRQCLLATAREVARAAEPAMPFRLPIDRAFQLRGLGTVVTGTPVAGVVAAGTALDVLPGDGTVRVRSVQVHGESREHAEAGERTALQLTGTGLDALERGHTLATAGSLRPTQTLAGELRLLADAPEPIAGTIPIRLHLYASEAVGRLRPLAGPIAPGGAGPVEIRLAHPVVAVRGDRFVVRRPSPQQTLGGGVVLDPLWRQRRGQPLTAALADLGDLDRALRLWVAETGERAAAAAELAPRLGWPADRVAAALARLAEDGGLVAVDTGRGRRWLVPAVVTRVTERARRALAEHFAADRLATGMPKAELLARVLPQRAMDLGDVYLRWLEAAKVLTVSAGTVTQPGRKAQLTGEESDLSRSLLRLYEEAGLTPPSPGEAARRLGVKPQIVDGVVRYLADRGKIVRLPAGLVIAQQAIDHLRRDLLATGWERFAVGQFKDRFALSRKWAIPLLEHLDSIGQTRRVGEERQVVGR